MITPVCDFKVREAGNGLTAIWALQLCAQSIRWASVRRADTRHQAKDPTLMAPDFSSRSTETASLLKSPTNAAHLAESIEQFRAGKVVERDTIRELP